MARSALWLRGEVQHVRILSLGVARRCDHCISSKGAPASGEKNTITFPEKRICPRREETESDPCPRVAHSLPARRAIWWRVRLVTRQDFGSSRQARRLQTTIRNRPALSTVAAPATPDRCGHPNSRASAEPRLGVDRAGKPPIEFEGRTYNYLILLRKTGARKGIEKPRYVIVFNRKYLIWFS